MFAGRFVHPGSFYDAQPVAGYNVAPVQQEQKPIVQIPPRGWLDVIGQNPLSIFDGSKNQILIGHKRNSATDLASN